MGLSVQTCSTRSVTVGLVEKSGIDTTAIWDVLQGVLKNQQAIAEATGIVLPYKVDDIVEHMPEIKLPLKLRTKVRDAEAFDKAVSYGYIRMDRNGQLVWMLENKTLLAYLLGRLFCGDYSRYSRRKGCAIWYKGDGIFPETDVNRLFGMATLKKLRQRRINERLPEGYELIDNLF